MEFSPGKAEFRTVAIGGLSRSALREKLRRRDIRLNGYAEQLLRHDRFVISPEERLILEVVEVAVRDLVPAGPVTSIGLAAAAREAGLAICPLEMGPFLRLQYRDQPIGPRVVVSSALEGPDESTPTGFYLVRREDGLWLRGYHASPDHPWGLEERFVFVRPS